LNWPGVHEFTYWQFPLYLISEGLWLRIFPVSIQSARLFSVLWGCLYLAGWFLFARGLSGDGGLSVFVASVVATDYALLSAASDARMDMMCAALGQLALASYVCLRDSRPRFALILSALFGATSLFCHPMGFLTNFALVLVVLSLDWNRLPWSAVPVALLFYLVGIALYVKYMMEDPAIYRAQSSAAAAYRFSDPGAVLQNIFRDFRSRYVGFYFNLLAGVNKLKVFSLLFGIAGDIGIALTGRLRSELLGRTLLLLTVVSYVGVAVIDNQDLPVYFVYSVPVFTACGAFWAYRSWPKAGPARVVSCGLLVAAAAASLGGFAVKIRARDLTRQYQKAVAVIRKNLAPGDTVYGGAELGFALGFGRHLVDDRYLGYWSDAPLPAVYAMNQIYVPMPNEVAVWNSSRKMLAQHYRLIFSNRDYRIYLRNDLPPQR
jgi:hypothetical protein